MIAAFSRPFSVLFRGLAQLAFCDTAPGGVLILSGLVLVSPWSGLGALAGCAFGTAIGYLMSTHAKSELQAGLAGFNPAIIGIFWGGFLAEGTWNLPLFLTALSVCMALDFVLRRVLALVGLPALSAPAVVTAVLMSLVLAAPGMWFWVDAPAFPLGQVGIALALVCFISALALQSGTGAGWAMVLGAIAYFTLVILGRDPLAAANLWAVTVPLAYFAMHAAFLRGSVAGAVAGTGAALGAGLAWFLWTESAVGAVIPPLLAPLIVGIWLAIGAMRQAKDAPLLQLDFWRTVIALNRAALADRPTGLLVGDSTLRQALAMERFATARNAAPVAEPWLSDERLRESHRCRRAFWELCERLRSSANDRAPKASHRIIANLQRSGWLRMVLSEDIYGSLQDVGVSQVVALNGRIDQTLCIDCGSAGEWPPARVWRSCDIRCTACNGVLRPAVNLFDGADDQALQPPAAHRFLDCGVLLIIDDPAQTTAVDRIIEQTRNAGGLVAFLVNGPLSHPLGADDLLVSGVPEKFLATLETTLSVMSFLRGAVPLGRQRHQYN